MLFESTWERIQGYVDSRIQVHCDLFHNCKVVVYPKHCEVCGCVIADGFETKGKPEVRVFKNDSVRWWVAQYSGEPKEYIYTPYYCLVHSPKDTNG